MLLPIQITGTEDHLAAVEDVINPRIAGFPSLVVASNVIAIGLLLQESSQELLSSSPDKPSFRQNAVP